MNHFKANVKCKKKQAAGLEDTKHFTKGLENIRLRNVHDRVESYNGGPGVISNI